SDPGFLPKTSGTRCAWTRPHKELPMMTRTLSATMLAAALTTVSASARAQVPQSFTQKIIVPAYFQPGNPADGHGGQSWNDLASAAAVGAIIFNPNSGPADPSFVAVYHDAI